MTTVFPKPAQAPSRLTESASARSGLITQRRVCLTPACSAGTANFASAKHTSHNLELLAAGKPKRKVSCRCTTIGTEVESGWKDDDFIEVGTLGRPHGVRGEVVVSVDTSFPEERFANPGVRYIQPPPARGMFVSRPNEAPRQVELVKGRPHVTKGNSVWLLTFKEIADRDAAESLRNYRMLIHKDQRVPVDGEHEFYSQDLVGLTVLLYPYHSAAQPSAPASQTADDSNPSEHEDAATLQPVNEVEAKAPGDSNDSSTSDDEEVAFWDLGKVSDVYDGTGTHGVIRIDFSSGLKMLPEGTLTRVGGGVAGTKDSGLLPFAREIVPEIDLEEGVMIVDPPEGWLEMYLTPSKPKKRRFKKRKSPKTPAVAVVTPDEVTA